MDQRQVKEMNLLTVFYEILSDIKITACIQRLRQHTHNTQTICIYISKMSVIYVTKAVFRNEIPLANCDNPPLTSHD